MEFRIPTDDFRLRTELNYMLGSGVRSVNDRFWLGHKNLDFLTTRYLAFRAEDFSIPTTCILGCKRLSSARQAEVTLQVIPGYVTDRSVCCALRLSRVSPIRGTQRGFRYGI